MVNANDAQRQIGVSKSEFNWHNRFVERRRDIVDGYGVVRVGSANGE